MPLPPRRRLMLLVSLLSVFPFAAGAGAAETRTLRPADVYALRDVDDPQLSPEGRWVAYTVTRRDEKEDESDADLYMSPLGGGPAVRLTAGKKSEKSPRWSPDG